MAALDTFRNCSNFTVEQPRVIAHVRGVSAVACCAVLSTVLVVLVVLVIRAILPKTRNEFVELLLNVSHLDSLQSVCFTCLIYHCNLCSTTTMIRSFVKSVDF